MDAEHHNRVISKAIEYITQNKTPNNGIATSLIEELKAIKTKYHKETFLAMDAINDEHEEFNNIKDARSYLKEAILDIDSGYHPDAKTCKIYTLTETVKLNTVAKKEHFTTEDWEELYDDKFDDICELEFVKV